ncbi:Alkanesulfonate monooxygenase [Bradyrhizobium ivorense]|uniref:Alkanesulfonate monooxygenase n=1 Tax=Bradyrhizobium ivorense TaxID=2511166 RepID=A0A508U2B3_9BRAD|nr:LLM class flavin-dependent oxidoreductase [Bradyrhizobium ivorense]VIO80901.1 Alkanesulfonate monooxygenase [Bradyrhizobium ivorense]
MRPLEFGWYLPTHGDTTAYGLMEAQVAGSPELCERVVKAAEDAGFEYLLIPVGSVCWEAWITGAFMAARSGRIKPLIAARPGYINPVLLAKMISTFDQMSDGRICINLIAGQNESEVEAEGVRQPKEERYALMEEEVSILKALWTTRGPVHFEGKFHTISGAHIRPRPLQQPYPKFYLGGGSRQAWELSAKHSDVHLFWGDLPERIAQNIAEIRQLARAHDRADAIGFGMRLQVICRENEADGWEGGAIGAPRHRAAEAGDEDALYPLGSQSARAAAGARLWRLADAASVDRDHQSAARRRHRGGRQSRTMRRYAAAVHRRRLPFVLPVRLSA